MPLSLLPNAFVKLRLIIGLALLALALAGCSMVRLGYGQGPNLLYWWIDGYIDASGEQSPRLREAIDRWFAWHSRTQLPEYAAMLARVQREVAAPTTTEAVCAWAAAVRRRIDVALEAAVPDAAELMLTLTPEQLQHIERRLTKGNTEMRADFLQADAAERRAASLKRTAERFETVYGRLDAAQQERLAGLLAKSNFDAERWLAERRIRQREMLQTLAGVSASRAGTDRSLALQQAQAAARMLAERSVRSPRADYRAYQQGLEQDTCRIVATMHNAMTPAQRQAARTKFKGWEDDARSLVAAAATAPAGTDAANR